MKVCTWNIQLGLRLDRVLEALRSVPDFAGLDLLCLQEASVHSGRQDAAVIAHALGQGYGHFQATAQHRNGWEQGNALVWRRGTFEPGEPQVVSLDTLVAGMTRAEQALLRAVPPQRRIAVRAESTELRVYVVHLDVIGFTHKLEQLKAVITDMDARPGPPLTIVAGDLNTFGPPALQLWRRLDAEALGAGLVDVTRHIGRTHWTAQKLDAIFVRSAARLRHRAWTVPLRASDHHPVFAELDFVDEAGSA